MIYLIYLPLLILTLQPSIKGVIPFFFLYLLGCFFAGRSNYKQITFKLQYRWISVLLCFALAVNFCFQWIPSNKMTMIAGFFHLPANVFLCIVTAVLAFCSIWGIDYLISGIFDYEKNDILILISEIMEKNYKQFFIVLSVLFTFLYCLLIRSNYVWVDEAYSFAMIHHTYANICKITAADVHPPLYYIILKFLIKPFQYSLAAGKLASIIPYLFIIIFGGIEFKRLFNKKTSLLFMILFFLFPFLLPYSIEIRMYSWAAAFTFGNAVFAYRCFKESKKINWMFYIFFGAAAAYTHYFALVSVGIIYGILLLAICMKRREKIMLWIFSSAVTIILYLPWLKSFAVQLVYKVNYEYWIPEITIGTIVEYYKSIFSISGIRGSEIFLALAYLFALIYVIKAKIRDDIVLSVCILTIPVGTIGIGILASILVRPVFIIRYLIPAIPLLITFMAIVLGKMENQLLWICIILITLFGGIINYKSVIVNEYKIVENELDDSFVSEYSNTDCYVDMTSDGHVSVVLSYYETGKLIYVDSQLTRKQDSNPVKNLHPINQFDVQNNDIAVLFLDAGEVPGKEYALNYKCDYMGQIYVGQINTCVHFVDVYLLTK